MDSEKCEIFNCSIEDLIRSGFYFEKLFHHLVCCACGWESGSEKKNIIHLNFIHSAQSPNCDMVKRIPKCCKSLRVNTTSVEVMEDLLRKSFLKWPKSYPDVEDFVKTGFYYTGIDDAVTCVHCDLTLEDWQPQDIPGEEHKKANPTCNSV